MYHVLILLLIPHQSLQVKPPCTAAAVFLRPPNHNSDLEEQTYTIPVTYPCDSSPLQKIEKLKKSVPDPYISFYLKRSKREFIEGSGGGGVGDYDDDDDEDDDEEEDELEEEDHDVLEPSNHVIPVLPTPTFEYGIVEPSYVPELQQQQQQSSGGVVLVEPSPSTYVAEHTEDELVFALGSGDGPVVLSTPVYNNPSTTSSMHSTTTTDYYSSSSSSSSSAATPTISSYMLHPIQKQLIYSGVPHTFTIPENTFQPKCSYYDLVQTNSEEPWVDVEGSTVRFFPTTNHISDYTVELLCQPYNAPAEVYVSVRQRQKSRLHNHAFQLEFGMIRGNLSRVQVMNRITAEINNAVGGNSTNNLVVLSTELDTYPFRLTYVNESIITNVCPTDELKRIYKDLQKVSQFIHLERVTFTVPPDNNQCEASKVIPLVTGEVHRSHVSHVGEKNYPPSIKNQIDRLNGSVGEYLVYHVKEDFCYDPEDGGTRNLRIELRNSEMGEVGEDYWLQFDSKNQEFYGLPMSVEERAFVLVCADSGGQTSNDVLELQINPPRTPPTSYNTEFELHFKSIPFTPKAIRKFIEKLSSILSPHIQVNSYVYSNNHVLFKWFNTTNPSTEQEVTEIRGVMLSDDGPVNKKLYEHFTPEFNVTVSSVIPLRKLLSENNPVEGDEDGGGGIGGGGKTPRYFDFDEVDNNNANIGGGGHGHGGGGGGGSFFDSDTIGVVQSAYLTTYIIPSVLIAAMIVLALIIACLLSRKNKYTQASTEDDSPNARVYLKNAKKGVPVIFQDELEEKAYSEQQQQQQQQQQQRGNIYEPPHHHHHHLNQQPPPPGTNNRYNQQQQPPPPHHHNQTSTPTSTRVISPQPAPRMSTPQPPDYQNSISRSMMRNRPPPGGVGVYPGTHTNNGRYNNIDSYAPPPGINYYGIHTSNSGGSGFSGSGIGGGSRGGGEHMIGSSSGSSKMAPPPYVPP